MRFYGNDQGNLEIPQAFTNIFCNVGKTIIGCNPSPKINGCDGVCINIGSC